MSKFIVEPEVKEVEEWMENIPFTQEQITAIQIFLLVNNQKTVRIYADYIFDAFVRQGKLASHFRGPDYE